MQLCRTSKNWFRPNNVNIYAVGSRSGPATSIGKEVYNKSKRHEIFVSFAMNVNVMMMMIIAPKI